MAQQGRAGMGTHKHGTSGRGAPSPRAKLMRALDANERLAADAKKKPKATTYLSLKAAMEAEAK